MTSYIITSDAVLEAAGPYTECRITGEVNVGTAEAPTWEPRAYRAVKPRVDERRVLVRSYDESDELEFPTWHNACRWLRRLGLRNLVITHESRGLF